MSIFKESYTKQFKDFVCVDEMGNLRKPNYVSHKFKEFLKKNGLRKIRFHDLRHSHASLLLKENVPAKVISERLGHSNVNITLNLYSHIYKETNM